MHLLKPDSYIVLSWKCGSPGRVRVIYVGLLYVSSACTSMYGMISACVLLTMLVCAHVYVSVWRSKEVHDLEPSIIVF